jgi:hypothetical protein
MFKKVFGLLLPPLLAVLPLFVLMPSLLRDPAIPIAYDWDGLWVGGLVKGTIENGWYLTNPQLGAPGAQQMLDFPYPESLHFLLIKFVALFSSDYAVVYNGFFMLGFALAAFTAHIVFRQLGVAYGPALAASVLYAYLPSHIGRGIVGHLFLASYYVVPLLILVALWITQHGEDWGPVLPRRAKTFKVGVGLLICAATASAGIYYACFAMFLLLLAGLSGALRLRRWGPLVTASLAVTVIVAGIAANLAPTFALWRTQGRNPDAVVRVSGLAPVSQLQIAQLVLPVSQHRFGPFRTIKARFNQSYAINTEQDFSSLGLIGSAGFLFLLFWLFARHNRYRSAPLLTALAHYNGGLLLLATTGGGGCLLALFCDAYLRAYFRTVVYLEFFALCTFALFATWLHQRLFQSSPLAPHATEEGTSPLAPVLGGEGLGVRGSGWKRLTQLSFALGLLTITILGIIDQTPSKLMALAPGTWPVKSYRDEYLNDQEFVRRIEAAVPARSMIFQLPYVAFPESPVYPGRMRDFDLLRGYLHSKTLRWSYGAMKGRELDAWEKYVAHLSVDELVPVLLKQGFQGVTIDRFGFADSARELEARLTHLAKTRPLVSKDGRLSYVDLAGCSSASPETPAVVSSGGRMDMNRR